MAAPFLMEQRMAAKGLRAERQELMKQPQAAVWAMKGILALTHAGSNALICMRTTTCYGEL